MLCIQHYLIIFKEKQSLLFVTENGYPVVFPACSVASCRVSFSQRGSFNCVSQQSGSSLTRWPKVNEERAFPSRARSGQKD